MAKPRQVILTRKKALILATVLSLLLFLAGLFSGLAASKIIKEQTQRDLSFLTEYVNTLDSQLRSTQIQEQFVNSLSEEQRCNFAQQYYTDAAKSLNYYWHVFPARLEQYEQRGQPSEEYLRLKSDYTRLALRTWLVARENNRHCHTNLVPILYFYSKNCTVCETQGEVLDKVKEAMQTRNTTVLPFTLDLNYDEPSLKLIKEYYNLTEAPALVIDEQVLQGRLFSEVEISTLLFPEVLR